MHSTGLQKPRFVPPLAEAPSPADGASVLPPRRNPARAAGVHLIRHRPHRMSVVQITRIVRFNCAHRVWNPALSEAENARLFGKCNNPNWHGHNYTLEVTVDGPVDPTTGFVVNLRDVKAVVEREIVDVVDHKNLNLDVPFMAGTIPSTENFVLAIWRVLAPAVAPARLARLKLWETENQYVEYDGR